MGRRDNPDAYDVERDDALTRDTGEYEPYTKHVGSPEPDRFVRLGGPDDCPYCGRPYLYEPETGDLACIVEPFDGSGFIAHEDCWDEHEGDCAMRFDPSQEGGARLCPLCLLGLRDESEDQDDNEDPLIRAQEEFERSEMGDVIEDVMMVTDRMQQAEIRAGWDACP